MRAEIEQAVALLRSGDEQGVEQALALLQNTVFSFSMRVCGQREDAEDTMQEVLARSLPHLPKFESPRALLVWLYKVAKTRCLMSRRRSKFAPHPDLSLEALMPDRNQLQRLSQDAINPEMFAIRSEQAVRLRSAIQKLPPPYRIVLVMRDMEGLSDEEVAEITGLRPGTVRVRLHRARLFVRNELMKTVKARDAGKVPAKAALAEPAKPARCKALFAELSNYLDERLDDSMCARLEKHLDSCEPCKVFLATLEATIENCRAAPAECPGGKKAERLRRHLVADYKRAVAAVKGKNLS